MLDPIGSVLCDPQFDLEKKVGELEMLCVRDEYTGKGIGQMLMDKAEELAIEHGCRHMRLELLSPQSGEHPVKKWLSTWFKRTGYA